MERPRPCRRQQRSDRYGSPSGNSGWSPSVSRLGLRLGLKLPVRIDASDVRGHPATPARGSQNIEPGSTPPESCPDPFPVTHSAKEKLALWEITETFGAGQSLLSTAKSPVSSVATSHPSSRLEREKSAAWRRFAMCVFADLQADQAGCLPRSFAGERENGHRPRNM